MLYSGFNTLPRSVVRLADSGVRWDNADVIPLDLAFDLSELEICMNWIPISKLAEMGLTKGLVGNLAYWETKDGAVYHQNRKLRKACVATFEVLADEYSFVARDRENIYHAWSLVKAADRDTFEALGDFYFRDKLSAYAEFETSLKPLKGQDPASFTNLGSGYARDSSHGYFWGKPLRKCESPMTLKVIESRDDKTMDYAMDSELVYCEAAALKGADLDSWQPRSRGFSLDRNTVFYCADRLAKADPHSWQHVSRCFSKDDNYVFYMNRRIKDAQSKSWVLLGSNYSTDGVRVYYGGKIVDDGDAGSFKISDDGEASDQHGFFDSGVRRTSN